MGLRVGGGSSAGSARAVSDSASLDAQIIELNKKRLDLIAEKRRLQASGGSRQEIAAIERRIKLLEEKIKRLEEQKQRELDAASAAAREPENPAAYSSSALDKRV